jgi:hypothetical protein
VDGIILLTSKTGQQESEQPYRSITLPRDDSESVYGSPSGSEIEDEGKSDDDDAITLTTQQEALKSLEEELNAESRSVDKWLLLLSHTLSSIPITSKNASKARSEISVSILARAIAADPQNRTSKVLRLRYMKAGEQVWHESKVRAEWEDALKTGGIELWMEWFEWKIRKAEKGVDGIVEDAMRLLATFDHDEPGEIARIRVFWRVAITLQNAGTFSSMLQLEQYMDLHSLQDFPNALWQCSKLRLSCKWFVCFHPKCFLRRSQNF